MSSAYKLTPEDHVLSAAIKRLTSALEAHTPGKKWRAKLESSDYGGLKITITRPGKLLAPGKCLSDEDAEVLAGIFLEGKSAHYGPSRSIGWTGLEIRSSRETITYAVELDADIAEFGHLPPNSFIRCGKWNFPGNRNNTMEERFKAGTGYSLDYFAGPSIFSSVPSLDPMRMERSFSLYGRDGSVSDYIAAKCGDDVAEYVRSLI